MNPTMAAAHRERFMASLEGGVAVFCTGPEQVRSRDTHFKFRPDSDFWYLTAFPEPDAVVVLRPGRDEGRFVLFVRPRDPELETWHGRRAGVLGAAELYGADEAYSIDELDEQLPKLLKGASSLTYSTGHDTAFDTRVLAILRQMNERTRDGVLGPVEVRDPAPVLHEMRLHKKTDELELMRRAAAVTDTAHRAAMKTLAPGVREYEIEAVVDGAFRAAGGWGPGYTTICASGDNANVLHYTTNDMEVQDGDLLLLDAGCEIEGYTADVTRTFPANGRFSDAQRELYEVVLAAELAGIEAVRPGNSFNDVHESSLRCLLAGMIELKILSGTVDAAMKSGSYKPWFMHKTSHWLGLDVHDVGLYMNGKGDSRPLAEGMILTVEPGLYFPADDDTAPERYRGIGIRIEDDILVTADGHENLTAAIPKTIAEVEAAC
ncbi:MAG: Xaa-Pro aminopeptidase [Pseudohongiellaceae bacterium]|jgi:Xaa-Pro aminopeptidase